MSLYTTSFDNALAVTKSDSTVFSPALSAIYVGGTGDVAVTTVDGSAIVFKAVPVGVVIPCRVKQIMSTNTTATLMVGLW